MAKGQRTKDAIVAQALESASVLGLDGLSIGGLAAETGLSKSGLFAHFGSKEALQTAVLAAAAAGVVEQVLRPALRADTGIGRLRALFDNWCEWAAENGARGGCLMVAASIELDDRDGPVRDYLVSQQRDWLGSIARIAERAQADGDFRPDLDRAQFAHDLQAILLGYHYATRLMRDPEARDKARSAFERLFADAQVGANHGDD